MQNFKVVYEKILDYSAQFLISSGGVYEISRGVGLLEFGCGEDCSQPIRAWLSDSWQENVLKEDFSYINLRFCSGVLLLQSSNRSRNHRLYLGL